MQAPARVRPAAPFKKGSANTDEQVISISIVSACRSYLIRHNLEQER
jgi:hypothetical protein